MIEFVAHDFWSAIWVMALIGAGCVTVFGKTTEHRRILHVMILNWLLIRTIYFFFDKDPVLFLALSSFTTVALIIYGRTLASGLCAFLFMAIIAVESAHHSGMIDYRSAGELCDIFAFAVLLIMAGASNDFWSGRLSRLWRNRNSVADTSMALRRDASLSNKMADRKD